MNKPNFDKLSDEITCPLTNKTFQKKIPKAHWVELGYSSAKEYKKAAGIDSLISARNSAKRSASMKRRLKENPELKESRAKKLKKVIAKKKDVWSKAAKKRWVSRTEEQKREILQKGVQSRKSREKAAQSLSESWANLTDEEREKRCRAISEGKMGQEPWNKGLTIREDQRVGNKTKGVPRPHVDMSYTQTEEYREKVKNAVQKSKDKTPPEVLSEWGLKAQKSRIANGTPLRGGNGKKCTVVHNGKKHVLLSWGEYDFFLLMREKFKHKKFSPNNDGFETPIGMYIPDFWLDLKSGERIYIELKGRPCHTNRVKGTAYAGWFNTEGVINQLKKIRWLRSQEIQIYYLPVCDRSEVPQAFSKLLEKINARENKC